MRGHALAALGLGAALLASAGNAHADPKDYRFEAVRKEVDASSHATVTVRLVQSSSGKAVANAVLFLPKMEMPMTGMAPMATTVSAASPDGMGEYPFVADLSEAGPWTLTVSAKVQGEAATIVGSVPFVAEAGRSPMDGMSHHR